jgi:hypothetical protein
MKSNKQGQTQEAERQKVIEETLLPIAPKTGEPIPPRPQPGYYPGYHVLSQQAFWDEATRKVVMDRVRNVPPIRFFTAEQLQLMQAITDRLLPQDDREEGFKIPIVNYVDEKLYEDRIDGYRFADMPPLREVYRLGFIGVEAITQHLYSKSFIELEPLKKDEVLKTLHDANPPVGQEIWQVLPVHHYWTQLMGDVIEGYYSHPYAWDEIGFGGPAYPRGYMRLGAGPNPGKCMSTATNGPRLPPRFRAKVPPLEVLVDIRTSLRLSKAHTNI